MLLLEKDGKAVYSSGLRAVECRTVCPCQIDRVKMLREIMETLYSVRSGIKKPFLVTLQHALGLDQNLHIIKRKLNK